MKEKFVNYYDINNRASVDLQTIIQFLPSGKRVNNEWVCGNIFGDRGESFSYNIEKGCWAEFNGGQAGWGLAELLSVRDRIEPQEALKKVAQAFGEEISPFKKQKIEASDFLIEVPSGIKPETVYNVEDGYVKKYNISNYWAYRNKRGNIVYYDVRVDLPDGKKMVLPLRWSGEKFFQKQMPEPRLLYNLDKINEDINQAIIVVEGAKTAEAAQRYFPNYCVVTWAGGCSAYKKTDWEPLRNKQIILIPDADNKKNIEWESQPGMKAMNGIAHILSNKGCSVRIVDTRAMGQIKDGWDIADALEVGMAQEELVKFVKSNIYDYVDKKKNESFTPEDIVEEKRYNFYYDTTYFKCLGVKGDKHYFYNKKTGQIHSFSPGNYDSKHLVGLAPLVYWQAEYPAKSKEGTDWLNVADALCRIQEQVGIFDESKIRGRGAWFDDGEPVLHLGSCLFVKNQIREIDSYETQYFYEKSPSLAVSLQTVLTKEQGKDFINLCKLIRWDKEYYGEVLAGWLFSSLVCGAMPFRSHLYLIGAAGSGKSWIFDNIIKPVMGNIALSVSSKSTEAGIREALKGDVRPVIFDEAEAENTTDKLRMQAVFDIARQASSENADAIVKGTAGRGGLSYICRSAFLFASINNSMSKSADLSRTAFVSLSNPPVGKDEEAKKKDNENFRLLEDTASRLLDDEFQRCFLTRAIQMIPIMRESHKIIANVSAKKFGSRRLGDQMGMVLAGLWCLQNDVVIDEDNALKIIQQTSMQTDKADDEITQEERCKEILLHSDIKLYNGTKYHISYLIGLLQGIVEDEYINKKNLEEWLAANGVKIKMINGIYHALFAKNETSLASRIFKDTEWEFSWATALLRIEDILDVKRTTFHFSLRSNAIAIPLRQIIIEGGFDAEIL